MASLKEIKNRIISVKGTEKITSAMKMIASAKLHKGQVLIVNALPYQQKMEEMLKNIQEGINDFESPFAEVRSVEKVAIVAFSSNSGLCGTFNTNVIKKAKELIKQYEDKEILLFPIGKKIRKALKKEGYQMQDEIGTWDKEVSYETTSALATHLMDLFLAKKVDKVILLYHHFKGKTVHHLISETFLPFKPEVGKKQEQKQVYYNNFIFEPGCEQLLSYLYPRYLKYKFYSVYLDHNASEHGSRMVAMQVATDNANDLLQELTVYYNKTRQQSITNELLDIMGGAG